MLGFERSIQSYHPPHNGSRAIRWATIGEKSGSFSVSASIFFSPSLRLVSPVSISGTVITFLAASHLSIYGFTIFQAKHSHRH